MRIRVVSRLRLSIFLFILVTLAFAAGWQVASSAASCAGADSAAPGQMSAVTTRRIVVGPGDSLWSISAQFAPSSMDPRFAVYELRKHNGLSSSLISIGQQLTLPDTWPRADIARR